MTKLAYKTPVMNEEQFAADEYVAACWTVACELPGTNEYYETQGITHMKYDNGEGCGHAVNQVIKEDANGKVSMVEVSTQGLGDLPCTMTDSNWNTVSYHSGEITDGMKVYWTTSASGGRTWHHRGTASVDGNHS